MSQKNTNDRNSKSEVKNNQDSFDSSYSKEIIEHLNKVNMDPWYFIYGNYVNPPKKDIKKS